MSDLFWPGDERAGAHFAQTTLLEALLRVEEAWLDVLVEAGVAPASARAPLSLGVGRIADLARAAEPHGTPVAPLLAALRGDLDLPLEAARWLHRGLSDQDVLDTALVLLLREATRELRLALEQQVTLLVDLAVEHRDTPLAGRGPGRTGSATTFGVQVAGWLGAVLDAHDDVTALRLPVQTGGPDQAWATAVALGLEPTAARAGLAARLGLLPDLPWATTRTAVTRAGDALARTCDAVGRIARDVLAQAHPDVAELAEGTGAEPEPVLAVLVRRAALTAPGLAATLHLAAAEQADRGAAGAWHAEWATLRDLARRTLVAAGQTTDLLATLVVHADRMAEHARPGDDTAGGGRDHERGATAARDLVDAVVGRAHDTLDRPARPAAAGTRSRPAW